MDLPRNAKVVAAARLGVGAGSMVAPRLGARLLGIPAADTTPAAVLFAGLFGVREAVLGALTLGGADDPARMRRLLLLNAAADAGDAVILLALAARHPSMRRAAVAVVPAAIASVVGHVQAAQALA